MFLYFYFREGFRLDWCYNKYDCFEANYPDQANINKRISNIQLSQNTLKNNDHLLTKYGSVHIFKLLGARPIMNLKENLLSEMKGALKGRESLKLGTIRSLVSEIKNQEIDLRRELDNDEIVSIIITQIKKRKEAATLFAQGGRNDLCEKENQEMTILQKYLPEQVSEESLRSRIQEVIIELEALEMKDLGKVMKKIIPEFKGRADNEQIKNLVAECLEQ